MTKAKKPRREFARDSVTGNSKFPCECLYGKNVECQRFGQDINGKETEACEMWE